MDVEYIALETNDEFINQGFVQDIGKETILVKNRSGDGNIFVYDRTGKALRVINHKGQGGEEYVSTLQIRLDEDNGEIFINDHSRKKIVVYDLNGKFRRSFNHREGDGSMFYTEMFNFDKDNLICYDEFNKEVSFVIVSKQDGSITKEIKIPFDERLYLEQQSIDEENDMIYTSIVRTPTILSMDPGVFLMIRQLSDHYYFFETIKNEIYMNWLRPVNNELESWQPLEAYQLIESYEKGELKGELKNIASTLNEDSNPVIMLIKHKR